MKNILLLAIIVFLAACGAIMINENDYRLLKESHMEYIKPFDQSVIIQTVNNKEAFNLYEINADNIRKVTSGNRYTWLHLWNPVCSGEDCENVSYYQIAADQLKESGVVLLLISDSYRLGEIKKRVVSSSYNKPETTLSTLQCRGNALGESS